MQGPSVIVPDLDTLAFLPVNQLHHQLDRMHPENKDAPLDRVVAVVVDFEQLREVAQLEVAVVFVVVLLQLRGLVYQQRLVVVVASVCAS